MLDDDIPVNEPLEMVTATPKANRQFNDNHIARNVRYVINSLKMNIDL